MQININHGIIGCNMMIQNAKINLYIAYVQISIFLSFGKVLIPINPTQ